MVNGQPEDAATYFIGDPRHAARPTGRGVAPPSNLRTPRVLEATQRNDRRAALAASHAAVPSYAQ
eukprot:2785473-Pyramimonas_sp.AAC.1